MIQHIRIGSFLSRRAVWMTLFSLTWVILLAMDVVPQLRGGYGWQWIYEPVLDLRRIAPLMLGVTLYVSGALWLLRRRTAIGLLTWAVLGSVGLVLAAAYVRDDVLYRMYLITVSGKPGGWHMAAMHVEDLYTTLHNWPEIMAISTSFSTHMGISPPGTVVVYYAGRWLLEQFPALADALVVPLRGFQCQDILAYTNAQCASAWLGMLMPVWSSLTILPLYHLGRRVFGQEPARWGVVWWPLVPSFLLFAPLPNILYPLPTLLVIGLLFRGLDRNQAGWVVAAGIVMSLLTFLTFTFLPLLLFAGLLTLGMYGLKRIGPPPVRLPWHWPVQMGLWFGLGLSTVWLVFHAVVGLGFWDIWSAASHAHLNLSRPYWPWLILHLNDFFMFTGWPLTLLAGAGLWVLLRKVLARRALGESEVMILAAGLTVLILNLSGTMRGEAGRILLFFSPWLLWTAAHALEGDRRLGNILTIVQGITAIVMIVCLHVLYGGSLLKPEFVLTGERRLQLEPDVVVEIPVGSGLQLVGYDVPDEVAAGERLNLTLYWRAVGVVPPGTYTGFAHVVDAETRTLLVQDDHALGQGQYPPNAWQLDEVIVERYVLPLAPEVAAGEVAVQVGAYTWPDLNRLQVPGHVNDVIELKPVRIR